MIGEDLPDRPADLDLAEIEGAAVGPGSVVHRKPPSKVAHSGIPAENKAARSGSAALKSAVSATLTQRREGGAGGR